MNPSASRIAGGRTRVGNTPTRAGLPGPMVPVSFAKQTKSLEERLYSRFRELDPDAVRVTRHRNGTVEEEVLLGPSNGQWISAVQAEKLLSQHKEQKSLERAIMRSPIRLGKSITKENYQTLSDADKDILRMSQRDYNSFRALQGAIEGTAQTVPNGEEGTIPPAKPSVGFAKQ